MVFFMESLEIQIEEIVVDEGNQRQKLQGIEELAASFKTVGQIQPVIVKRVGERRYQLIAGHRRLAAAKTAEFKVLSAVVLDVESEKAKTIQLVENIQRENLSAVEVAESLHSLMQDEQDLHHLGRMIGKSDKWVRRHLALLKVDTALVSAMQKHRLSFAQAEEVVRLSRTHSVLEAVEASEKMHEGKLSKRDVRAQAQTQAETSRWRKMFSCNGKGYLIKVSLSDAILRREHLEDSLENKIREIEHLLTSENPPADSC